MNKIIALTFAAITAITMTGCVADGGYGYGYGGGYGPSYGGPRSYGNDYDAYGYGGPSYSRGIIYIDGHACHHDRDRNRYYYTSGSDRVYITQDRYDRYRSSSKGSLAERQREAEAKYNYAKNKGILEAAKNQNEWKERQARYNYEQQKKQYQYDQKVVAHRNDISVAKYKQGQEQQKKQWEYQQKAAEYAQRQAVAKWKAENGVKSDDDDKKKKKH